LNLFKKVLIQKIYKTKKKKLHMVNALIVGNDYDFSVDLMNYLVTSGSFDGSIFLAVGTANQAKHFLEEDSFDFLVLCDDPGREMDGLELLTTTQEYGIPTAIISDRMYGNEGPCPIPGTVKRICDYPLAMGAELHSKRQFSPRELAYQMQRAVQ